VKKNEQMIHRVGNIEYTKNNACSNCLLWASWVALVVKKGKGNLGEEELPRPGEAFQRREHRS